MAGRLSAEPLRASPTDPSGLEGAPAAPRVGLAWLMRLRWTAIVVELGAIVVARWGFSLRDLPTAALLALVGVTAVTNLALPAVGARAGPGLPSLLGSVLVLDTLTLTALLALSGGPSNPFSVLYMVQVALAAVVLGSAWTWTVVTLSIAGFASLFLLHVPLSELSMHGGTSHGARFDLHLYGMLLAFAIAAILIAYVVTRVSQTLRAREAQLAEARERNARSERLAALTTLAAGAAHELGTPLGTIAVVARELEREAEREHGESAIGEDARLIRAEVDRCRTILDQLGTQSGESAGEAPSTTNVAQLVRDATELVGEDRAARLQLHCAEDVGNARLPRAAFARALANLLKNAFDASAPEAGVQLGIRRTGGALVFEVQDDGAGMSPDVLERATEPFYTTKDQGEGMGLGLFLARALAEQLGGRLELDSAPDRGTTVRLEVPAA